MEVYADNKVWVIICPFTIPYEEGAFLCYQNASLEYLAVTIVKTRSYTKHIEHLSSLQFFENVNYD